MKLPGSTTSTAAAAPSYGWNGRPFLSTRCDFPWGKVVRLSRTPSSGLASAKTNLVWTSTRFRTGFCNAIGTMTAVGSRENVASCDRGRGIEKNDKDAKDVLDGSLPAGGTASGR